MTTPIPIVDDPPVPEYTALVELLNPNNLASMGMIEFITINATLYHNTVGSWSILCPYSDSLWNLVMSGNFIVRVNWRGLFTFGGKCEQPEYSSSIPGASSGGSGASSSAGEYITLSGADYLSIIANRICYPHPELAWSAQLFGSEDTQIATPLETAIKYYVTRNVGPQALASRQHPLLDVATDQHRGPPVNYSVNFSKGQSMNLLDVIRALVAQANPNNIPSQNMGVSIVQNPQNKGRLLFDVYNPRDLSKTATFSEALGNLTSVSLSLADPTCTDALVQGSAKFVQQSAAAPVTITPWTKVEKFVDDTSETNANNLNSTAANTLLTGSLGPNLTSTTTDTPYLIYGRDYHVGDIVAVEVVPTVFVSSAIYSDIVSSVSLSADASQAPVINVVPVIGSTTDPSATNKTIQGNLINRIKTLEKKLATQGR
jgi:hypothetical protein